MNRLQVLREARGYNRNQLEVASGVSRSLIAKVENGERDLLNMRLKTILKLCTALDVSIEELIKE